ncbi:hypothetical protein [Hyphococcus sp.]|uniref:hypothetical protein n=1 Tax=Hyphococcus sp. TaxID=2038636 RepID=UPI003CCBCFDD
MNSGRDQSLKAARDALKKAQQTKAGGEKSARQNDITSKKSDFPGGRLLAKALGFFDTLWNVWARPFTRLFNPITDRVWQFYRWSYSSFAYARDETGAVALSRNRAIIVTFLLAFITITAPVIIIRNGIPLLSRTVYDAGMLVTMKEDRLFLGRAELIDTEGRLYQVMGCRDISGCDGGDNTTYYRLRDNVILDVKYWITRFEPYDPAEIAGAMVSELNDCSIRYYGRRSKALGWYPYIVNASCVPV